MSKEFWNEKYDVDGYRYGIHPNQFVAEQAEHAIPEGGRVLCLGSGEGRNAVWLAERGFEVTAVDASDVGLDKTRRLAGERGVEVQTVQTDIRDFYPDPESVDAVVMTYFHLPPELREVTHERAAEALKPGGVIILEAFRPEQLERDSGGPPRRDMLYTFGMLQEDFASLHVDRIESQTLQLDEGLGHTGVAEVIRMVARKPE